MALFPTVIVLILFSKLLRFINEEGKSHLGPCGNRPYADKFPVIIVILFGIIKLSACQKYRINYKTGYDVNFREEFDALSARAIALEEGHQITFVKMCNK